MKRDVTAENTELYERSGEFETNEEEFPNDLQQKLDRL